MNLCLVGNLENRRVRDFRATAEALGFESPQCVGWREVLDDPQAVLPKLSAAATVRIDSPGENDEVQQRLIRLGGGRGRLKFGEVAELREQYEGFSRVLDWLSASGARFQNPPADIRAMFDKWASHERFATARLPRPRTAPAPQGLAEFRRFRTEFCSPASGRIFLKPRYASSASGVCAYRWSGDREQLIAPIELLRETDGVRLYNWLRFRHYTSLEDVRSILSVLLPQGMIAEQWIRKGRLPDGQFDLRIVVIAGEARHVVVRQSHAPMTNLHLGNRRGDLCEVEQVFGKVVVERARRVAEDAAACFPDSLYAGVDVLIPARGEPLICEINAFGDLLPNVTHRGETTYEAILRASYGCGIPV